ncbi:CoA pyrophosphatase [Pseudaestuariivita sp.]|uniref:CoA pyrophosphatase n=1 Tax=Pseudaestuariivita sp. TaxID=2211669 RepID=UPI004058F317
MPRDLTPDLISEALSLPGTESSDFDLNAGFVLPEGRKVRDAAVLVPILQTSQGLRLLLTKRSSALKHHPGQVAFPGGKCDPEDADTTATALREAWEEVRLPPEAVQVVGALPPHETVTSFTMTPVVGLIDAPFDVVVEPNEVAEAFTVPLGHALDLSRFRIEGRMWRGQMRRYYAVPFGPYYIWGATARILRGFAERAARCG